jgi:hypothetical protein
MQAPVAQALEQFTILSHINFNRVCHAHLVQIQAELLNKVGKVLKPDPNTYV